MVDIPSDEIQKRALDQVVGLSAEFRSMTNNLREKWLDFYRMYRLFKETGTRMPWESKLWIARTFEVVEKITPRLTAHNPKFILLPRKSAAIPFADIMSDYLSYVWEEEDLKPQIRLLAKNMLIYGTAIAKVEWNITPSGEVEETQETETDEETGEEAIVTISEEEILSEMPRFSLVDIFDFDVDPREESVDSGVGVIHNRDNVDVNEILSNEEIYFNLDKVVAPQIPAEDTDKTEKKQKMTDQDVGEQGEIEQKNRVSIKEYWGKFSETGKPEDEKEYIITVINNSTVIRLEENKFGFRPFVVAKDQPVPHEFYGIGEIEPVESLQIELNWLRNQRMDNVNLVLNRMFVVDNDSGVNPSQLVSKPGNVIFKNPGTELNILDTKDVTSSSYKEEDQINRDFQTITSTIDFTDRGGSQGFTNTATGEKIRAREKNERIQYKVENLEESIRQIAKKMLILTSKFVDQDIIIRKLREDGDSEFVAIDKSTFDDIANGFLIKVETGSMSSDSTVDRRNDALALFNLGANAKQLGVNVDLVRLWKDVVQKGFGFTNPESTLMPEGQMAPGAPVSPMQQGLQGAEAPQF